MTTKTCIELINKYCPKKYKSYILERGEIKANQYNDYKERLLFELKVHFENSKRNGVKIIGIKEIINTLSTLDIHRIKIIVGRNMDYSFRFYVNNHKLLGVTIIARRRYSEQEINEMNALLDIKTNPPSL